jgi:5'-deoxynucleotidase YfbR-like HD superfamily hydrolase
MIINNRIDEFLNYTINRLSSIKRYNTRKIIIHQSVMEHTGEVALIGLILSNYFNEQGIPNDTTKVLKMALIHDMGEVISGDLPHDVKYQHGKLSDDLRNQLVAVEDMSMQYISGLLSSDLTNIMRFDIISSYNEYKNRKSVESKIVKLADFFDVVIYSKNEMKMGNKTMKLELDNATKRAEAILKEIYEHKQKDELDD